MGRNLGVLSFVGLLAATTPASVPIPVVDAAGAAAAIEHTDGTRLVFIWEATCAPCRRVFPKVQKLATDWHSRGVRVISFSVDEEPDHLEAFLDQHRGPLSTRRIEACPPAELDQAMRGVGIRLGNSFGTPLFAVLDGDGRVVGQKSGGKALSLAEQWLGEASGGSPSANESALAR